VTRPAHIAPLDEALEHHLADLRNAEADQARVLATHADELRQAEAAQKARQDAYYAAQSCEQAIRKLGYVVLRPGGTVPPNASRLDGHPGDFRKPIPTTPAETDRSAP
jgi:hypothetical protein